MFAFASIIFLSSLNCVGALLWCFYYAFMKNNYVTDGNDISMFFVTFCSPSFIFVVNSRLFFRTHFSIFWSVTRSLAACVQLFFFWLYRDGSCETNDSVRNGFVPGVLIYFFFLFIFPFHMLGFFFDFNFVSNLTYCGLVLVRGRLVWCYDVDPAHVLDWIYSSPSRGKKIMTLWI